jgi:hypothetical protein
LERNKNGANKFGLEQPQNSRGKLPT